MELTSAVSSVVMPEFTNGESTFSVLSVGSVCCEVLSAIGSFVGGKNLFVSGS